MRKARQAGDPKWGEAAIAGEEALRHGKRCFVRSTGSKCEREPVEGRSFYWWPEMERTWEARKPKRARGSALREQGARRSTAF